ncbi:hypothetical protein KKD70_00970 [Patescibacteria group bacterium]|nr:hypothetical protein [Patescibacteria group bacterium]
MGIDTDLHIDSNALNNIEQERIAQNRKLGLLLILAIFLIGIGFYVIWGMFLNKGSVIFVGEPPFAVTVKNQETVCLEIECRIDLPAQSYNYSVIKDGYYYQNGNLDIVRGDILRIDLDLVYIPGTLQQAERTIFALPVGYSKFTDRLLDISLFAPIDFEGEAVLKKLPKKPGNIVFSQSGEKAMVFEDGKMAIYDTRDFSMKDINSDEATNVSNGDWDVSEQEVYFISHDVIAEKGALKKVCIDASCESENLVYFLRDIEDYEIAVSSNKKFAAILDKTQKTQIIYIIDIVNATRTNVFEGYLLELGDWSDDGEVVVFQGKDLNGDNYYLRAFDTRSGEIVDLGFSGGVKNTSFYAGTMYFLSTQGYSLYGDNEPYLMNFDYTSDDTFDMTFEEEKFILGKWDFQKNEIYFVKDLSEWLTSLPEKIEVSKDGLILRILSAESLYDLRIGE